MHLQYTLTRSYWLRRISMRITPDGSIHVRSGLSVHKNTIDAFVVRHWPWIEKQRHKFLWLRPISQEILTQLYDKAQDFLPRHTYKLAHALWLEPTRVTCRHQKTRWGSCSSRNAISLNIELMRLPEHLRNYVIIHELVHIIHKHHKKAFWDSLEKVLPWARQRDRELRRWSIGFEKELQNINDKKAQ